MNAALAMPALSDDEDSFPTRPNLQIMPNDQDQREVILTTPAPDTDRAERDTQPPGPADVEATRALQTMLPGKPPLSLEDSYLDQAIRVVAAAGDKIDEDRGERRQQHEAVIAAIRRADENGNKNYELLRDEIRHLKDSDLKQDQRLKEGDKRFDQIEQSIADLKTLVLEANQAAGVRIKVLEDQLAQAKADAGRPPAPAAPAPAV
jgi:hypothetical protein